MVDRSAADRLHAKGGHKSGHSRAAAQPAPADFCATNLAQHRGYGAESHTGPEGAGEQAG